MPAKAMKPSKAMEAMKAMKATKAMKAMKAMKGRNAKKQSKTRVTAAVAAAMASETPIITKYMRRTEAVGPKGGTWRLAGWEEIWVRVKGPTSGTEEGPGSFAK